MHVREREQNPKINRSDDHRALWPNQEDSQPWPRRRPRAGDTVVVIGEQSQVKAFKDRFALH